jgi:hypothetical protein
MKTYYETEDGTIDTGDRLVPKGHIYYNLILEAVNNGEAELIQTLSPQASVAWDVVRAKRNQMLRDCDWTVLPDTVLENKSEWIRYRKQLREIPQTYSDPNRILWPLRPSNG